MQFQIQNFFQIYIGKIENLLWRSQIPSKMSSLYIFLIGPYNIVKPMKIIASFKNYTPRKLKIILFYTNLAFNFVNRNCDRVIL